MNVREETQVRLDGLADMLAHWVTHVRHPAQFWPQFERLAAEILDQCERADRRQAHEAIQAMLKRHARELPAWHQRDDGMQ